MARTPVLRSHFNRLCSRSLPALGIYGAAKADDICHYARYCCSDNGPYGRHHGPGYGDDPAAHAHQREPRWSCQGLEVAVGDLEQS